MATNIDRFYPEGEDYYDEPEFWFDGGSGCCPCGGPGCDGSCDTYAEYRRERKAAALRDECPEAWTKHDRRATEWGKPDGKYIYVWYNKDAFYTFKLRQPVREDEIPF